MKTPCPSVNSWDASQVALSGAEAGEIALNYSQLKDTPGQKNVKLDFPLCGQTYIKPLTILTQED